MLEATVRTYHGGDIGHALPAAAIQIHNGPDGVRLVLQREPSAVEDVFSADVYIERRPKGWAVVLTAVGGGDPAGVLYIMDDEKSPPVFHPSPDGVLIADANDPVPRMGDAEC